MIGWVDCENVPPPGLALRWLDHKVWVCLENPLALHSLYRLTIMVAIVVVIIMNFWAVLFWLVCNDLP